jgi:putative transposase
MKKSRFTTEQIIGFIKQADAGMAVSELARQNGFSPASFYAWRAKYGGMEAEDAKRLKELEQENNRLKRLLAEAHLDIEALKVGFGVNASPATQARGNPAHVRTDFDQRAPGLPPCGAVPRCFPSRAGANACHAGAVGAADRAGTGAPSVRLPPPA